MVYSNLIYQESFLETAVREALLQAKRDEEEVSVFEFRFSQSELNKLDVISKALGLSYSTCINSAIKYAIFYAQTNKLDLEKVRSYPKRLGRHGYHKTITTQTLKTLEQAGIPNTETEKIQKIASLGIRILHRRLLKMS